MIEKQDKPNAGSMLGLIAFLVIVQFLWMAFLCSFEKPHQVTLTSPTGYVVAYEISAVSPGVRTIGWASGRLEVWDRGGIGRTYGIDVPEGWQVDFSE